MIKSLKILVKMLFLLAGIQAMAQPSVPKDNKVLMQQLNKSKADTVRVNLLIKLVRFDNSNFAKQPALLDSALAAAYRAKILSEKLGFFEGTGLNYQVMAQTFCAKKNFKKSDDLIKKAIAVFLDHDLYRDAAEAYLNMEEFYLSAGGQDYKIMIGYYEQAQPLFHKAGAFDREGATLAILGDFYHVTGDQDKALERLNRALVAYKKANYPFLEYTYDLLGFINELKSRYQEALRYGLLAEKTAKAVKDSSLLLCTIYNRLGDTYTAINKVEQAKIYFHKALEVAKKYKDTSSMRLVSLNLFDVMRTEHKSVEALAFLKNISRKFPPPDSGSVKLKFADYIWVNADLKNYAMAERYADSLLKTSVLSRETVSTVYSLSALNEYLIKSQQYNRAVRYLPIYRRVAAKLSIKREEYQAYLWSFKSDSARKDYLSAINNYRRYFFLKDSLYDLAKTGQLEELKIKYETEQKEKSIATLERNSILQQDSLKRANTIRNGTITGSLILLILIILLYKSYRINKQNSQAIHKKNLDLNQLVTEKEWLLKEIHHRVKNNLQIVMGLLQRQSAYINSEEALAAIQISENRMHSIALIHQKLYQSENLDLICMPEYIHEMINYLKDSTGLDSRILFEEQVDEIYLDVAQAVPLGLIMNEAITNAIKYAYRADESGIIKISLQSRDNGYNQLIVVDHGTGLPAGFNINKVDSLGINLMRGLTKQIGGSFEIVSEQGCLISVRFKTEIFKRDLNNM